MTHQELITRLRDHAALPTTIGAMRAEREQVAGVIERLISDVDYWRRKATAEAAHATVCQAQAEAEIERRGMAEERLRQLEATHAAA
jgi:hypothetical protein